MAVSDSVDWSLWDDEDMHEAVEYASSALAKQNPGLYIDTEDLTQEAWILLAHRHVEAREQRELGYLNSWLYRKLHSKAIKTEASRAKRSVGQLREAGE